MARRALDYLVGFTLSPVLWRKLPGSAAPGVCQSVALRLICEREAEIEIFRAREYWTIEAVFITPGGAPFTAKLTHLNGKRLISSTLNSQTLAEAAKAVVEKASSRSLVERQARPPQSAAAVHDVHAAAGGIAKTRFGAQADHAVRSAIYEGVDIGGETTGLITYMRTAGVQMAREAIGAIRDHRAGRSARTTCQARRAVHHRRPRTLRRRTRRSGRLM